MSYYGAPSPQPPSVPPHPAPSIEDELCHVRRAHMRPVFRVAGAIGGLYMLVAVLASEARDFMATELAGPLNIGLALGLLQCVTTAWATWWYVRHARATIDPLAGHLRSHYRQGEDHR